MFRKVQSILEVRKLNNNKRNNKVALIIGISGSVMTVITMYVVANLLAYLMSEQYIGIIITVLWIGTIMFFTSGYTKIIPTNSNRTTFVFCLILILTAFIANCCYAYAAKVLILSFDPLESIQAIGYTMIGITGLWIK